MKKRFTEEQIIKALQRIKNGMRPNDLARELGVSQSTVHNWKSKFDGMTVNEARRTRELEIENARLKKIVADLTLDITMLKDVNSKKW